MIVPHAGWISRGYLPHCDERGLVQHIIFGLADAMIGSPPSNMIDPTQRAEWAGREFDRGRGRRLLAKAANAEYVEASLLHDDGRKYALAAWCVMPTHVHVVVEQFNGHTLSDVVQAWKSVSSHRINKTEGLSGSLWRREYFDRFMRTPEQFEWTVRYVENNPVKAKLAKSPEAWMHSSAYWKQAT